MHDECREAMERENQEDPYCRDEGFVPYEHMRGMTHLEEPAPKRITI